VLCCLWLWARIVTAPGAAGIGEAVGALAVYGALALTYVDLHAHHHSSVRLKALRCIGQHGGAVMEEELRRTCGTEATVDDRLARYIGIGEIVVVGRHYTLGRRHILHITRIYQTIRWLLLGTRPDSM